MTLKEKEQYILKHFDIDYLDNIFHIEIHNYLKSNHTQLFNIFEKINISPGSYFGKYKNEYILLVSLLYKILSKTETK